VHNQAPAPANMYGNNDPKSVLYLNKVKDSAEAVRQAKPTSNRRGSGRNGQGLRNVNAGSTAPTADGRWIQSRLSSDKTVAVVKLNPCPVSPCLVYQLPRSRHCDGTFQ
jgi:hypothetical protein